MRLPQAQMFWYFFRNFWNVACLAGLPLKGQAQRNPWDTLRAYVLYAPDDQGLLIS